MQKTAEHPGLYDPEEKQPRLFGTRCDQCDTSFFPPLGIGCEVCGSPNLSEIRLSTAGTVHSAATVHRHSGKNVETPFIVAEILLDDGPLVRALLEGTERENVIGERTVARWFEVNKDSDDSQSVEPRFVLCSNEDGNQ